MNAWWAGLTLRERAILAGGVVSLVVLLFWLAIWEPLAARRAATIADIQAYSADLAWMEQVAGPVKRRARQSGGESKGPASGSVLTLIEVSASAAGMRKSIDRVQPEGAGARIWLEETAFDALLVWLSELEQRHGLRVTQLAVDAGAVPGVVSAQVKVEPR